MRVATFKPIARAASFLTIAVYLAIASVGVALAHQGVASVTLRSQNEPVRAVLLRIARMTGASISVADAVGGYVTVELHGVALQRALHAVLDPLGLSFRLQQGVYVVETTGGGDRNAAGSAPAVLPLSVISAKQASAVVRPLFPQVSIREDGRANALVVVANAADLQAIRAILQGIDVRDPSVVMTEAIAIRSMPASALVSHLAKAFPRASFSTAGEHDVLVTAKPLELGQVKAAINALDTPIPTPAPSASSTEAVPVTRRPPRDLARSVASQIVGLRAAVSGSSVVLSGPPEVVSRGKALIAQLDVPTFGEQYAQVYRIRSVDAGSLADLLRKSFRSVEITVDSTLNAVGITATAAQHQRIADAIAQLDAIAGNQPGPAGAIAGYGNGATEVVALKSYVPGGAQVGGPDAVSSITQALQIVAPDVRVIQLSTPGQIALVGSTASVRNARDFIDKVDIVAPLVVLDTEILEVDENVAKNLGLQLGTAAVSSTFTELQPPPNVADGTQGRIGRLQALTRTPISFTAQLNLLIQNGKGRVLADPRITTLSGRTASIRAGDTISILTTTAGNAGTIATTQVQSFQTGVTLDITPSVTPDGAITVALHPVVNSLIGTNAGVPEISTRDTQTTVHLQDNETLVIGGLIQENDTRTTTKLPVLGDLPIIGGAFRSENVQGQRNELIIVVTPHIVKPGSAAIPGPALEALPTPAALPTLPPGTRLPSPSGQLPAPAPTKTPAPRAIPSASTIPAVSPTPPAPAPSAFAQTNVFTFGSAPQSNFARPTDAVQIFYATLSPTVVANGTSVHVAAITSSNASSVKLVIGTQSVGLAQTAPGQWQAVFPYPGGAISAAQTPSVSLVVSRPDGMSVNIAVPLSLLPS